MPLSSRVNKQICVRDKWISDDHRPYIIAEIACAHNGDLHDAKKLIDVAVASGADAVQLELFDLYDNAVPNSTIDEIVKKVYFTPDQWKQLFTYAKGFDIAVSAFVYDYKSLELALSFEPDLIKLNSSDLSYPEMISRIAKEGIPCTMGTGASTIDEISNALLLGGQNGGTNWILMHGLQNFPTHLEAVHLRRMKILKSTFDCLVGYADHTEGGTALSQCIDLMALGLGASVIEKHIILSRASQGIDYESALEPDEFKAFVQLIHMAYTALGPPHLKAFGESDYKYRLFQKKKVVAARDIHPGETLSSDMCRILRNNKGDSLSPMDLHRYIGWTIHTPISKYDSINLWHMGPKSTSGAFGT